MARGLLPLVGRALVVATLAGFLFAGLAEATSPELRQGLWHLVLARSARLVWTTMGIGAAAGALGGLLALAGHRLARAAPSLRLPAAAALAGAGYAATRALAPEAGAPAALLGAAAAWSFGRHVWESTRGEATGRLDLRGTGLALVAASLLGGGALVTSAPFAPKRPNLLLLVVDCLRPDHLGAYGYARDTSPAIDGLAARGVLFSRAYSTAAWTKPAVVSLLSGLYPGRHGVLDPFDAIPPSLRTLPPVLRDAGYQTFFLNGGNVFLGERFGFDRLFEVHRARGNATASELHADLLAAWEAQRDPKRPFFLYLHYMDAHLPYHENAESERFREPAPSPSALRPGAILVGALRARTDASELDDADRQRVRDLYDGQIRYVDQEIGGLISWLRGQGLLRDTVIVLTADHGEEFWEHGNVEHGHSLYEEVVRVPLIVFGPGIRPGRVDAPVSLVDVAPTLLRLAGVDGGRTIDGRDLLAAPADPERALRLSGTLYGPEKHALVRGAHKAIASAGNDTARRHLVGPRSFAPRELYDLAADPGERRALDGDEHPELAALAAALDAFAGEPPAARAPAATVDAETQARLRALGYGQ